MLFFKIKQIVKSNKRENPYLNIVESENNKDNFALEIYISSKYLNEFNSTWINCNIKLHGGNLIFAT